MVGRSRKRVRMQRGWARVPLRPELRREYDHAFDQDLVWRGRGTFPTDPALPQENNLESTQYIFCGSILILNILDYDTSGAEGSWNI
jgi:hypothetical protein